MSTPRAALEVARVDGRSVVVRARSATPLRLLAPRNHGHAAWVFQSSFGGGFVGGDDVALDLEVQPGSTLFLSSQSSSKVYRGPRSSFELSARVGEGATLVLWPDPVVCFPEATFEQAQHFTLGEGANLAVVDAWSAGRAARGERWDFARASSRLTIDDARGAGIFHDALELARSAGPLRERLRGIDALATVVLAGPAFVDASAQLERQIAARPLDARVLAVASRWPWGLVLRLAAPTVEQLTQTVREFLRPHVGALLGDDPLERKW